MCGLCGFVLRPGHGFAQDALESLANNLLLAVDHRGGDATGFVAVPENDRPFLLKAPVAAKRFTLERPALPADLRFLIGHTRLATQGAPEWTHNNHPVRVGDTYLAHNGHIYNQVALSGKVGTVLQDVDSALLAALIDRAADPVAALDDLRHVDGAAAVTYWNPVKAPGTVVLARVTSSPLYVWAGKRAVVWASTEAAIRGAWKAVTGGTLKTVTALAEGAAVVIHPDGSLESRTFERPPAPVYTSPAWRPWEGRSLASTTVPAPKAAPKGRRGRKAKNGPKAQPLAALPVDAIWTPSDQLILAGEAIDRGLERCDVCDDFYSRLQDVPLGPETIHACASCATWVRTEQW